MYKELLHYILNGMIQNFILNFIEFILDLVVFQDFIFKG